MIVVKDRMCTVSEEEGTTEVDEGDSRIPPLHGLRRMTQL